MGVAHGTNMEEKSAFTVLMGKAEGERYLWDTCVLEVNIEVYLK